ncbi:SOS response-associated peptidase family protein [Reichenbachiella sp.]|uniref:SOS response-associated peptidase n=3 Tax=Reichenbachiella sp. TaxID=2184521 RepID=UPI0032983BE1
MCYDAEAKLTRQIKDAIHEGASDDEVEHMVRKLWELIIEKELERDPDRLRPKVDPDTLDPDKFSVDEMIAELPEYHHVNGHTHPSFIMMTDFKKPRFAVAEWGFVHKSCETIHESYTSFDQPWMNSLNAQSETIFDKPTFAEAALRRRCVVTLDAFYEHYHQKGTTFPFRISHVEGKPLYVASIFNKNQLLDESSGELVRKNTVAFLTCKANDIMSKIHNNPKVLARTGPRMPVILNYDQIEAYLEPCPKGLVEQELLKSKIQALCQSYTEEMLEYRSVRNLVDRKGNPTPGNVQEITEPYEWPNLDYEKIFC